MNNKTMAEYCNDIGIHEVESEKKRYLPLLLQGDEQESIYSPYCHTLLVGTGETPSTLKFYERCGFAYSHRVPGFFTIHYDHPIVEEGVLLCDMVYLRKVLSS